MTRHSLSESRCVRPTDSTNGRAVRLTTRTSLKKIESSIGRLALPRPAHPLRVLATISSMPLTMRGSVCAL